MADDNKDDQEPLTSESSLSGYKKRQCGCLWLTYLMGGTYSILLSIPILKYVKSQ